MIYIYCVSFITLSGCFTGVQCVVPSIFFSRQLLLAILPPHPTAEWIAYHYTILPLRYLVVGVDEGNTQDPLPYLSQWEDLGLQFQIISVLDDFLTSGLHRNNYDTSTFDGAHQLLKAKQRVFIQSCTKILRSWGVHWTSYVDIDEFLTYDNGYGDNNSSMARLLQDWQAEGFLQSPCYTIPRLRYGSQESANCSLSITLDGEESLTTRRFVQHARKGDFSASKFGKVLVNVSALSNETVDAMPRVVHRPFVPDCGPAGLVVNDLTRVLANHYTGGMDSFLSRADDARRSEEAWKEFARHDASHSCDNPTMSSWIERLVRQVGSAAKARELLKLDSMLQRKSV